RPLLYRTIEPTVYYGPYIFTYGVTNEFGEVTFDVSFDNDYLTDFARIFGSIEGVSSVSDTVLYIRVFSNNFNWDSMKLADPERYICSKEGQVFDGSNIIEGYDFSNLILQDSTYMEGIIRLHKGDIALGVGDYLTYDLPDPNDLECDELTINLYATEADPIVPEIGSTIESLSKVHKISDLEPLPVSILNSDRSYYASVEIFNPSGYAVENLRQRIEPNSDGGTITISKYTMENIIGKLGPGLSTIKIYVEESAYYKSSPVVSVPLEIRPPNWVRFGEKNTKIDLMDPLIAAWGSAFRNDTLMPFESNYPYIQGTIWFEPDFNGTGEERERSIQDYVEVNLICTLNDGSQFPLREGIMLRPGNRDGLMKFQVGLGPEDAYIMGLSCHLNLSFDISYNAYDIYENNRNIKIYLLDLRIVRNPSSSNPKMLWSLYRDGLSISKPDLGILIEQRALSAKKGNFLTIGGSAGEEKFGIEDSHFYESGVSDYCVDSESELFTLVGLSSLAGLAIVGKKNGEEFNFKKGKDWIIPYSASTDLRELSTIRFINNTPDVGTEFTIVYRFEFDFIDNYYGEFVLGPKSSVKVGWIDFNLAKNLLPDAEQSYLPAYARFIDYYNSTSSEYTLNYGLANGDSNCSDNFIIYNEEELDNEFGIVKKTVIDNHLRLKFSAAPPLGTKIIYGVRSQYQLGFGFQKIFGGYSDSIRLAYNDESFEKCIVNKDGEHLSALELSDPSLYIGLDDSSAETVLELYQIPLLYAPEINITFKLDPIIIDQIKNYQDFSVLIFKFYFVVSGEYNSYYSDTIELRLNYAQISEKLDDNGGYSIRYNKDLQSIYDAFGESSLDVYISISQEGTENFIPYVIMTRFDYLCDEHLLEMFDRMPRGKYGGLDVKSVINTPHYFQILTKPLRNSPLYPQFPDSPFNLLNNSEITVALEG
ncbi:MAG: hypothetical protein ACTSQ8_25235, partial [Candidatus Helarchaeota archaeon]